MRVCFSCIKRNEIGDKIEAEMGAQKLVRFQRDLRAAKRISEKTN